MRAWALEAKPKANKSTPEQEGSTFPVDGSLLRVLPRASASLRNPDVHLPTLRSDGKNYYLEMQVEADSDEETEVAVTRRIPLEDLSEEEWAELKEQYERLDLASFVDQGLKGLEKIQDRRVQRLVVALLTFLNPRQVSIVLFLYRAAAQNGNQPIARFRSNDLLAALGYKETKGGGYPSKLRSQLHCDLVALHRTELVFAESLDRGDTHGAKVTIKNVLRIKDFEIDNVPRDFDILRAADYTHELADSYTVSLEFFEGPSRTGDYVLFANSVDISQRIGGRAKHDYKTKLLLYLASRLKWDNPTDGQFLTISKRYLFKNLDLLGSNTSRNNQIFWRTIDELREGNFILGAKDIPGKGNSASVQFQINPSKIRTHTAGVR